MNHRRRFGLATLSTLATFVLGCSGGSGEGPLVTRLPVPPPAAREAAPDAGSLAREPVALAARSLPDDVVVDGSTSEWGLDAKRNVVIIGVGKAKVVLAIAWAGPQRPTVALALATPAPMLPSIGWSQRGGTTHALSAESCEFEQIPLIEAGWTNGNQQPPEVTSACMAILARYEKAGVTYAERFIRRLRIDGATVSVLDREGAATPLAGAVVRAQGSSAEIELPLVALPDTNQAPLAFLSVGAVFGDLPEGLRTPPTQGHPSGDPPAPDPAWTSLTLDAPVAFGAHPDILALVFQDASGVMNGGVMNQLSYAPARPETYLSVSVPDVAVAPAKSTPKVPGAIGGPTGPDRPALAEEEHPVFTPLDTFGKVTFGDAGGVLVTLVADKVVAHDSFGRPDATERRGEDLHLFSFSAGGYDPTWGHVPPRWNAVAIKPDGKIAPVADEGVDAPGQYGAWDDPPKPFNSPDWTSFGLRGKRRGKPKVVTWRWDAAKSSYVSSVVPAQPTR